MKTPLFGLLASALLLTGCAGGEPVSKPTTSEEGTSEETTSQQQTSEGSSEETLTEKLTALQNKAQAMDAVPNFTINAVLSENGAAVETDRLEIDGNEYLFTFIGDTGNYLTYHKLDTYGQVNKYYEITVGGGYSNHPEWFTRNVFDTGYFMAFGKYDAIDTTLTELLSTYASSFVEKTVNQETALSLDHVAYPLDLELARQNCYAKTGKFAGFKKESYPDWVIDDFLLFFTEDGFRIEYDCEMLLTEYGSSGTVDFTYQSNWFQHVSLSFSKIGSTSLVKPEGIPD